MKNYLTVIYFKKFQSLAWRKQNRIDTIHDEDWTKFKKQYPYYLSQYDKEGKPGTYPFQISRI